MKLSNGGSRSNRSSFKGKILAERFEKLLGNEAGFLLIPFGVKRRAYPDESEFVIP